MLRNVTECYRRLQIEALLIAAFVCLFSLSGIYSVHAEAGKIGFVDLSRAFDEYQKTKDFDKALEDKGDLKQNERERMVKEIRKMRDELEFMNEKAREEKEMDIEAKIRVLQEFDQDTKAQFTKERDDMVLDILKEMNEVIQLYGQARGYSIILNERVLLYGDSAMDITDDIIKILNENPRKR